MKRASSFAAVGALVLAATAWSWQAKAQTAAAPAPLNYEFFKNKVQPVFLAKREGHARCVVCHTFNNAPFKLVPLSAGTTTWNEQQSRMNFELVKRVAMPGFLESKLLKHPLADDLRARAEHGGRDPRAVLSMTTLFGDVAQNARLVDATSRWLASLYDHGADATLDQALRDL